MTDAPLVHFRLLLVDGEYLDREFMFDDKGAMVELLMRMLDGRPDWLVPLVHEGRGETVFLAARVEAGHEKEAREWLNVEV